MIFRQVQDTISEFLTTGPQQARAVGTGVAAVGGVLSSVFGSILSVVIAVLFLFDLVLGVLKAVDEGGLGAFEWGKFGRAFVKLGATMVGIALFAVGDLLLHETGVPDTWHPLSAAVLFGMAWGFFWSALANLGYFFPDAQSWTEGFIRKRSGRRNES